MDRLINKSPAEFATMLKQQHLMQCTADWHTGAPIVAIGHIRCGLKTENRLGHFCEAILNTLDYRNAGTVNTATADAIRHRVTLHRIQREDLRRLGEKLFVTVKDNPGNYKLNSNFLPIVYSQFIDTTEGKIDPDVWGQLSEMQYNTKPNKTIEIICGNCERRFAFLPHDASFDESYAYAVCPHDGVWTRLSIESFQIVTNGLLSEDTPTDS